MYFENIPILKELNIISIIARIFLALLLGGFLGLERERKQRPAGFRTYIVVCLGSTLACITNLYMCEVLGSTDPARIPAQVISGIGFLGAGTILVTRNNNIKGLTTAAGLWCVATIGIAVGTGFYTGAIIGSIAIVFSLRMLTMVDKISDKHNKYISIFAEFNSPHFTSELFMYCQKNKFELHELELFPANNNNSGTATFSIKVTDISFKQNVLIDLQAFDSTLLIQELR